jgi:hypothetical protein
MHGMVTEYWKRTGRGQWRATSLGTRFDLIDVGLPGALVDRSEKRIDLAVFGKPSGHLAKFLTKPVYSLVVHIRLCNKFWHRDYVTI